MLNVLTSILTDHHLRRTSVLGHCQWSTGKRREASRDQDFRPLYEFWLYSLDWRFYPLFLADRPFPRPHTKHYNLVELTNQYLRMIQLQYFLRLFAVSTQADLSGQHLLKSICAGLHSHYCIVGFGAQGIQGLRFGR